MCISVCPGGTHHPIQCIVPPHMLRVIALRGESRARLGTALARR